MDHADVMMSAPAAFVEAPAERLIARLERPPNEGIDRRGEARVDRLIRERAFRSLDRLLIISFIERDDAEREGDIGTAGIGALTLVVSQPRAHGILRLERVCALGRLRRPP